MNSQNSINMQVWNIDYDYIPLMQMELVKGRNFSREFGTDSNATIINEATAKLLGWDDPIGKKLYTYFQDQFGTQLISRELSELLRIFIFHQ
jgi:putative ABC transport system permease protein